MKDFFLLYVTYSAFSCDISWLGPVFRYHFFSTPVKIIPGDPCSPLRRLLVWAGEASIALGIARDRLYSTTRDREGAWGRGLVGYLARRISGYGVEEIAAHFGRSPQTMSEGIKKVEDLQRRDKLFAKRLSLMLENVVKRGKRRYRITEA
jgi:hypothetical protein